MNHFLSQPRAQGTSCRFGLYAMEAMPTKYTNSAPKRKHLGRRGRREYLHISVTARERNVLFARQFCRSEGIRIVAENVLGNNGRVVMLDRNFQTIAKTIANRSMDEKLAQADRALARAVNKTESAPAESGVTLF